MRRISKLSDLVAEFPGIGPRQARRIVQFLLSKPDSYRSELARDIAGLGTAISQCALCLRYDELQNRKLCTHCADESRDTKTLMVVERDVDIDAVEGSGAYRGMYFVLGGLIPMARQKKNGTEPRISQLESRIQNGIRELIIALSTTPEGDYTAHELSAIVKAKHADMHITLLGRGLSIGAEIEYADSETLRNALQNRN